MHPISSDAKETNNARSAQITGAKYCLYANIFFPLSKELETAALIRSLLSIVGGGFSGGVFAQPKSPGPG